MSYQAIDDAGLEACAALLMDLVEGALSLTIFDENGGTVWTHVSREEVGAESVTWLTPGDERWNQMDGDVLVRSLGKVSQVFARRIKGDEAGKPYFLYLQQRINSHSAEISSRRSAQRSVVCLSDLLGTHYALNHELNSMTDELARRYEELNLVYNTDEQLRSKAETELVLKEIAENCIDYLNVEIAALILFEQPDVVVSQCSGDKEELRRQVEALRQPVFRLMSMTLSSVVVNTPDERLEAGLGEQFNQKLIASPIRDVQGRVLGALMVLNPDSCPEFDNAHRNLLSITADKLSKLVGADYDGLTGLVTREGFEQTVKDKLLDATRWGRDVCVLHANIDQVQLVNDTFGHEVGDDLIQKIATAIAHLLRENDRVSRLGGDEFGILLLDCTLENALRLAERVCENVAKIKCQVGDRELDVGISVGVAKIEEDLDSVISVMATADLACSKAKEQGRGRAFAYRPEDEEMKARKHQMNWVGKIQSALKNNRFSLFSQVIEPTNPNNKAHFEILLRMLDDDDNILSPAVFMPVAERYHLMPSIDCWVIEHSLATLERWYDEGSVANSIFGINLSGQSLMDERTLEFLLGLLKSTTVNPENLCFEITENAAITDFHNAQRFIAAIKNLGCKFALDDFGAGVSSFANLRALDVDYLKIDGSFVVDMATDPVSESMVAAINQVGQTMELDTVAEFVESKEIRERLVALGVDYLQGYDIGKPQALVEQLRKLSLMDVRSA
ncbi:MAG: putative bifunctional diguanylate cyclase/phosphodiesterase [Gammaproteobacteria bacterium]